MSFKRKCRAALSELEKTGISRVAHYPLLFKLLHKFGLKIPLPPYNSFLSNVLITGIPFGVLFGFFTPSTIICSYRRNAIFR